MPCVPRPSVRLREVSRKASPTGGQCTSLAGPTNFASIARPHSLCPQKDDSEKPVSDQWLDPFVIVGEDNNPVGTVQDGERLCSVA